MARTEGVGRGRGVVCGCLPDVMPEGVQLALDDIGGVEALPGMLPAEGELARSVAVHKAMADPLRLTILHLLAVSPFCVCVIRSVTGAEDSKLSYHLGILKAAGLVEAKKEGSWMIYSMTGHGRRWLSTRPGKG